MQTLRRTTPTGLERHHTKPDTTLGVDILVHLHGHLDPPRFNRDPGLRRLPRLPRDLQLLTHHPDSIRQVHPLILDHHTPPPRNPYTPEQRTHIPRLNLASSSNQANHSAHSRS